MKPKTLGLSLRCTDDCGAIKEAPVILKPFFELHPAAVFITELKQDSRGLGVFRCGPAPAASREKQQTTVHGLAASMSAFSNGGV